MLGKHTSHNKKEKITVGELKKMLENFNDDDIISVMHYVEFGLKETFPIHNLAFAMDTPMLVIGEEIALIV